MREGRWADGRGFVCRLVGTRADRPARDVWCAPPAPGRSAEAPETLVPLIARHNGLRSPLAEA